MFMVRMAAGALVAWSALGAAIVSRRCAPGRAVVPIRTVRRVSQRERTRRRDRARSGQARGPGLHADGDGQPDVESRPRHVGGHARSRASPARR